MKEDIDIPKNNNKVQFGDDTIIIGDGSLSNLWAIKSILRGFEMASGLRINIKVNYMVLACLRTP